ncbi:MAG: NAD-dependent epimerase/dehydratase family protein [Rhodospirillales bacterium]|jgi:UDP-glucuronate 4-epimerase|nr:NAD-dependent epimerase/dehydratase family protein [Rhodospirillales bacterium]
MTVLVTGAAGFIGFHVARALLDRGKAVVGLDNLDPYYDVSLKKARISLLEGQVGFVFKRIDITDVAAMDALVAERPDITHAVHLAAQAGVRYSLENPYAYIKANVEGHLVVLETLRKLPRFEHLVFASSSSVYGGNEKLPFSVTDSVDNPLSLYAATKKSAELISRAYSHLHGLPQSGLRFFTVYGPWGRPDMAAFLFARKIVAGESVPVFNHGDMRRDFTYIDDVAEGVLASLARPPAREADEPPFRLYNLGNHRSEPLARFIAILEKALGRKAKLEKLPMQPGDVRETYADITESERDFGFRPKTAIDEGIPRFVEWFRDFYGV